MRENDKKLFCREQTTESERNCDELNDQLLTSTENMLTFIENAGSIITCTVLDIQQKNSKKISAIETEKFSLNSNSNSQELDNIAGYDGDYEPGSHDAGDYIVFHFATDSEKYDDSTHVEEAEQSMPVTTDDNSIDENNDNAQVEEVKQSKLVDDQPKKSEILEANELHRTEAILDIKALEGENLKRYTSFMSDEEGNIISDGLVDDRFDSQRASIKNSNFSYKNRFASILGEIDLIDLILDFGNKSCVRDLSNKLLIIKTDHVMVVKSRLSSTSNGKMVFVIDSSLLKQIKENTYNLDDLQYGIAKAIGIEPDKIKVSHIVDQLKNIKTDYLNVRFARMLEQLSEYDRYFSTYDILPQPRNRKNIHIEVEDVRKEIKHISLQVHNYVRGKKWLGGYKSRETDTLYLNASTQTSISYTCTLSKSTRAAQTKNPTKEKLINTPYEHSTQMWRLDHYIPADTDLVVNPGLYNEYEETIKREQAAIVFQKFWRGYKVRKNKTSKLQQDKKSVQVNPIIERIMLNMIYPYKKFHFLSLYWILKKRKLHLKDELNLIGKQRGKLANIACTIDNSAKELESLKGIEVLRQAAKLNKIDKEKVEFLEQSFGPTIKQFPDRDNIYLIEEYGKENCKRLKELYILYRREDLEAKQRLELLLMCLQAIKDCDDFVMKEDLQELLSRECILISSGVPENYLRGLRKRAEEIMYNLIKIPLRPFKNRKFMECDFSPIFRCFYCKKYKNCQDFPIIIESKSKICKSCRFTHRIGSVAENTSSKAYHLHLIRLDEYRRGCQNPYVTIIQPSTINDIIFKIWGGRCAISGETLFKDLRLVRWDPREIWAPWNSILLIEKEAKEHYKIKNVYDFYSEYFCNYVKKKNLMALQKYGIIVDVENSVRNVWSTLPHRILTPDAKTLTNASHAITDCFFHSSHRSNIC